MQEITKKTLEICFILQSSRKHKHVDRCSAEIVRWWTASFRPRWWIDWSWTDPLHIQFTVQVEASNFPPLTIMGALKERRALNSLAKSANYTLCVMDDNNNQVRSPCAQLFVGVAYTYCAQHRATWSTWSMRAPDSYYKGSFRFKFPTSLRSGRLRTFVE